MHDNIRPAPLVLCAAGPGHRSPRGRLALGSSCWGSWSSPRTPGTLSSCWVSCHCRDHKAKPGMQLLSSNKIAMLEPHQRWQLPVRFPPFPIAALGWWGARSAWGSVRGVLQRSELRDCLRAACGPSAPRKV